MNLRTTNLLFSLFPVLILLCCDPVTCQTEDPTVLKWEEDIRVFDSLNALGPADTGAIVIAGSSSIRLWDSIHSDLAPFRVIQRGYGGAKLPDFNHYSERIIPRGDFRAIIVFIGNDISGGEDDRTPEEMFLLYRTMIRQLRKLHRDTPVFWIETTPTPRRWDVYSQVREANEMIRHFCSSRSGLHFISTREVFINGEGVPDSTFFVPDMLHLNRDGYIRWSTIIKESLELHGITPSS
jgi:hypothetical protein